MLGTGQSRNLITKRVGGGSAKCLSTFAYVGADTYTIFIKIRDLGKQCSEQLYDANKIYFLDYTVGMKVVNYTKSDFTMVI